MDQKHQKMHKVERRSFLSLVTITIISRHSCKISREYFTFPKTLRNIPSTSTKFHKIRLEQLKQRGDDVKSCF